MPDKSKLLEAIRKRASRTGIVTADRYFREVEGCFEGGFCPTKVIGEDEGQWRKSLKEAESKLTYSDGELVVDHKSVRMRANRKSSGINNNWLLTFSARITSTRRDRDKDVLQTKGAEIDQSAPFLLHHMHMRPIGKLLRIINHTAKEMDGKFGISNTAEGRDGAQLVMDEVLRISHGFEPLEWKDMEDEEGFEFLKFLIFEVSGVSVPSNVDGHILGVDGKAYESELVKGWQKSHSSKIVIPDHACSCHKHKAIQDGQEKTFGEGRYPTLDFEKKTLKIPKSGVVVTKEFDVERQHVEASRLEYDWISRFCSCEVKQLINLGTYAARIRMGSFLTGLKHALVNSKEVDARRLTGDGLETPLEYDTIQLNSKDSDHFMVDGISFRKMEDGSCFAVKFERHWSGESIELFCAKKDGEKIANIFPDAWKWCEANNFLKGEAFSLSGEFIAKTADTWGDLFLEAVNETEVKRAVDLLNAKGKSCPNRGLVYAGPPGTGKTLSCRLMRNHADATFIWVAGKDAYYYGGINAVCQAFELAKELAPAIIVMEDIDAALDSRYAIDVLKTEMDGLVKSSGITTVLTTNHPAQFPVALLDRPGRFHDFLKFNLPSENVRLEMLRKWLPDMSEKARLHAVQETDGYSGAHVYELCQYSKTLRDQDEVEIDAAVEKALKKIADQRALIDDELMGDRKVAGRRRSFDDTNHIKSFLHTKALTPEPDEESVACPKCKSTNTEKVASENGNMHCQACGAYFTHDEDMSEDMDEEKSVRSFTEIEREYLAALATSDTDTLRKSHRRLSLILRSAEEFEEAREWDALLSQ